MSTSGSRAGRPDSRRALGADVHENLDITGQQLSLCPPRSQGLVPRSFSFSFSPFAESLAAQNPPHRYVLQMCHRRLCPHARVECHCWCDKPVATVCLCATADATLTAPLAERQARACFLTGNVALPKEVQDSLAGLTGVTCNTAVRPTRTRAPLFLWSRTHTFVYRSRSLAASPT